MPGTNKTPHDRFVETALAAAADPTPVVEVGIPMRDGVELAADVYLPREGDRPAPAIVTMTPYDKTGMFVAPEARFYQQNGDTIVEANTTDTIITDLAAGPELRIVLDPLMNLHATDFVL